MSKAILILVLVIMVILSGCTHVTQVNKEERDISIACWNLDVFGYSKSTNTELMNFYKSILSQYDIFVIQGIRDSTDNSIHRLAESFSDYKYIVSKRAGSTSKEQYAIFYNNNITLVGKRDYTSEYRDDFDKPPLSATFSVNNWNFTLYTIYTDKFNVPIELYHLEKIIDSSSSGDVIVAGTLYTDSPYYDEKSISNFYSGWKWLIDSDEDTTSTRGNSTYDMIIINSNCTNNLVDAGIVNSITADQARHYLVYAIFNTDVE